MSDIQLNKLYICRFIAQSDVNDILHKRGEPQKLTGGEAGLSLSYAIKYIGRKLSGRKKCQKKVNEDHIISFPRDKNITQLKSMCMNIHYMCLSILATLFLPLNFP